jgi:hypothetical protein
VKGGTIMLGNLDAIVATLAAVLAVSLVVQGVQQIFKQWLDLKSNYMKFQLLAMFDSSLPVPGRGKIILPGIRRVTALANKADDFAHFVVEGIEGILRSYGYKDLELLENLNVAQLKDLVSTIDWKKVPASEEVTAGLEKVNRDIERWFDIAKKGFQDLYERRMKVWAFFTSLVVVLALNANIFELYRQFSSNAPLRDAAISWADQYITAHKDSSGISASRTEAQIPATIRAEVDSIRQILSAEGFQLLGWKDWGTRLSRTDSPGSFWVDCILGWLAMTLLVSLGAPFWYDLLKTVMGLKDNLRSGLSRANSSRPPAGPPEAVGTDIPAVR